MDRGKEICQELKKAGIRHLVWLCDSETHFMKEAIQHDPELKVIKVCHEGEAVGICMGLGMGGARGALLVASQGLLQCGNILKCAIETQVPMLLLAGSGEFHQGRRKPQDGATVVKKNYFKSFLDAFDIKQYMVDSDADVARVGLACREANELRRPVALLLTSADAYEPGR